MSPAGVAAMYAVERGAPEPVSPSRGARHIGDERELAEDIWRRFLRGDDVPFRYVSDEPLEHDVQRRVPSTRKAREMLGFEATTSLDETLDEVVPWIVDAIDTGLI